MDKLFCDLKNMTHTSKECLNTVIGKRGYSVLKEELTSKEIFDIRKELTVKPFINKEYGMEPTPFPVYCESTRKLYLPRYYGLKKFGPPKLNKLDSGKSINVNFPMSLKEKQIPIVDKFLDTVSDSNVGGGLISVPCGYGKTVIGLYLCAKLKVKTLVVVHKEFLVNQWKERIKQFLPDAKIGKIQSNKIFIDGYDIVIGMLQSISMIEYDQNIFNDFGFVIYDECHHLGAETFSKALLKTGTKYTLGLSATPNRADGLSKVFNWYLGDMVYSIKKREEENVNVKIIRFQDNDENYCKEILNFKGNPNSAQMINRICDYEPRTNIIINETHDRLKEGRKILILSDRREHLKIIKEKLDEIPNYTSGFYLGGMKEKELNETETKNVILGTFSMASEGFDCKYPLDTIILTSPKTNIEQAVGRILRQDAKDRKFIPLIIDILDEFSMFGKQGQKRIKFYQKNNYNIEIYCDNVLQEEESKSLNIKSSRKKAGKFKKIPVEELDFLPDD